MFDKTYFLITKYINPYTDFGSTKLFGEEANLSAEQRTIYEENLIHYWGMKSALETAVEEAVEEIAVEENSLKIAKNLIALGLNNDTVAQATGLSLAQGIAPIMTLFYSPRNLKALRSQSSVEPENQYFMID